MSVIKKGGEGDDTPEVTKQEQEKSDALSRMHAAAKIAFRAPEWHARNADREAEASRRPFKDTPQSAPPTGDRTQATYAYTALKESKITADDIDGHKQESTDDGNGDDDGDTSSGKTGSGDGGGPSPDLTLESTGYIAFSDTGTESKITKTKQKTSDAEIESEGNDMMGENTPIDPVTSKPDTAKQNNQTGKSAKPAATKLGAAAKSTGLSSPGKGGNSNGGGSGSGPSLG
jgi:hypothetical protein